VVVAGPVIKEAPVESKLDEMGRTS